MRYAWLIFCIILVSGCTGNQAPPAHPENISSAPAIHTAVCGDGICETGENCCDDCGCSPGYACIDSECIRTYSFDLIDNSTKCPVDGTAFPATNEEKIDFPISVSRLPVFRTYYPTLNATIENGRVYFEHLPQDTSGLVMYLNLSECFGDYKSFHIIRTVKLNDVNNNAIFFDAYPQFPAYETDYENFVRPQDVNWWISKNMNAINSTSTEDSLRSIFHILNYDIPYLGDYSEGAWYPPNLSLRNPGDCKQISTTFLSLAKSYNSSLKCFNLLIPGHITTICKFDNLDGNYQTFAFFDQGDTRVKTNFYQANDDTEKLFRLRKLVSDYFDSYGISTATDVPYLYQAFNESYSVDFHKNEEFYTWLMNV